MFLDTNALRLSSRVRPCLNRKLQYLIMLIRSMWSTSGVVCPNLLVFVLVSSGWVASRRTESCRTVVPTARTTSLNTVTNVCVCVCVCVCVWVGVGVGVGGWGWGVVGGWWGGGVGWGGMLAMFIAISTINYGMYSDKGSVCTLWQCLTQWLSKACAQATTITMLVRCLL